MVRRSVVLTCALLVFLSLHAVHVVADETPQDRPDIIVVMVDDLGMVGDRVLERLPNIRSLWLERGLRFEAAYSETPLCCPGRAAFLTGQHTRRHGVVVNDARLLDPQHTIATALDQAGYFTVMSGKYLNGVGALADRTPPGWDRVAMLDTWSRNLTSEWWVQDFAQTAGFFDRFAADRALEWLHGAPRDQPLFMWLTPHAPHKADGVPEEWVTDIEPRYVSDPRCDGIRPFQPPGYALPRAPDGFPLDDVCRSLLTADDMVGQVRAEVERQGRDPYWLFTSDNGMAWGAHGFTQKNVPSSDRLPLYVTGPGVISGETSALVSNIDLAPTLADLAGVEMPRADGISFERVLRGEDGRRRAMLQDHPVGGPTGLGDLTGPWWAIRTGSWRLVVWRGTHLYQTEDDRWELNDLALDEPDMALRLARMWRRLSGPHGPARPPFPAVPVPTASPTPGPTLVPTPTPTVEPSPTPLLPPTPLASPPPSISATPVPDASQTLAPPVNGSASPSTAIATETASAAAASASPVPADASPPDRDSPIAAVALAAMAMLAAAAALTIPLVRRRLR